MNNVTTVGIDLAKNVFSLHGVDGHGREVLRRTVRRGQLLALVAQLPVCVIGLEACSGAHEWARQFTALGHTVRLMAPKLEQNILDYERELAHLSRADERAQRVQALYGVGPLTASAILASVGSAHEFDNGRQFAA